jgi:glycosyltransferase involved in cell wall biosynthesis
VRILLIGEFSRLHNSLKEGLIASGHHVVLIANGDGFKNYPADLSTRARFSNTLLGSFIKKTIFKIFNFDIMKLEHGLRFFYYLQQLKNYDVVQFINESPIQTLPSLERFLLKKIIKYNSKCFLLCCGPDYTITKYLLDRKERYSIMNPYFENEKSKKEFQFILEYTSKEHKKSHDLLYKKVRGVIASDLDYHLPMKGNPCYLGMIPNPINLSTNELVSKNKPQKIAIFLGINRNTYFTKGIVFFEQALQLISEKYGDLIEITISENLPYQEYITKYNLCDILLDQVYGFDQGYNALEAMAKGKVVFTGAEKEFYEYYKLNEKVAINALPSVESIVNELSELIENPNEIDAIGLRARAFVAKHHDHQVIANQYLKLWSNG